MTYAQTRIATGSLVILAALGAKPALAEGVPAGTLIENTATASYTDGGNTQTVNSNTVVVQVDELLDVVVASQDSGSVTTGAGPEILTFELTNTGNGPEAFELSAITTIPGNDFEAVVTGIAYDVDGNGQYDPAVDVLLASGEATPEIAADDSLTIFIIADTPAGVTDGQSAEVKLRADAATGTGPAGTVFAGQGVNGSDAVAGTTGADSDANGSLLASLVTVALAKSATIADPFGGNQPVPGSTVTFTIVATITGSGSIADFRIIDAIPEGTTYAAGTLALDASSLTDAADSDAGKAGASGIDVLVGTAAAGNEYSVTFDVTID